MSLLAVALFLMFAIAVLKRAQPQPRQVLIRLTQPRRSAQRSF